ncbi:hypothetical protein NP603_20460 [Methylomonas sp. SURF-1]|uniref:Uncharacterized protein n=3 Tax=Methylomonas TaxID=416 RepID=A0AA91I754_9GAMM|nr:MULTISPECIES: hypothetical protein [Methylomonas]ANE58002.1 hypothetical protein AYM39_22225 [Methylomonas sp. DH-1]MCQ8183496.1 hypothetical protein [Methylomonas sp. SURF-1]MDX8126957.1 hypothetical protein [Methylomonas sp. OY6]OAI30263.1 hypothetical protein A1356_21995 [Methylomonas koyamae]
MSLKSLIAVVLATIAVSVSSSYWLVRHSLSTELEKLNLLTPVFVIDRTGWTRNLSKDASQDAIKQAMNEWQAKISHLVDSGFVVVDANMVVGAPEDVYVGE